MHDQDVNEVDEISIHALRVEGDHIQQRSQKTVPISIHALRVEGDNSYNAPPLHDLAISIHALRVEGDKDKLLSYPPNHISIHALRVEGDPSSLRWTFYPYDFYPRPPCGGRLGGWKHPPFFDIFLSTPSVWRATRRLRWRAGGVLFLSTPSVWRATEQIEQAVRQDRISIHALRVEGDRDDAAFRTPHHIFLSTPSVWRATFSGGVSLNLIL